jgi:hypothetical protein
MGGGSVIFKEPGIFHVPGVCQACYEVGGGSLSWGVVRLECGVHHPPPSPAEVKEGVELYFSYSSGTSCIF